jgi:hypothetical protein
MQDRLQKNEDICHCLEEDVIEFDQIDYEE